MENNVLKSLLKEYEKKKYYKELEFEEKKQEFFNSHTELKEINNILNKCAIDSSKAILSGNQEKIKTSKKIFNRTGL